MKNSSLLILVVFHLIIGTSQIWATTNYKKINFSTNDNSGIIINENNISGTTIKLSWRNLVASEVETPKGIFTKISLNDLSNPHGNGEPEIPILNHVIETPVNAKVEIQIISYEKIVISLTEYGFYNQVIPAQPNWPTSTKIEDINFIYNHSSYINSINSENEIAKFTKSAIMRDIQIGNIEINPVSYDPITNEVTILNNLKIKINYEGGTISSKSKRSKILLKNSNIQKLQSLATAGTTYDNAINYVIVSPRDFETTLDSFVQWKIEKGFNVTEAYTDQSDVGSTLNDIKTYLTGLYNNEDTRPDYILLVGDIDQIPSWPNKQELNDSSFVTDLYYAEYTDDYLPECYYSRLSANNTNELKVQLDKIIAYEKYEIEDPTYLDKALFVAGIDDSNGVFWGNTSVNYVKDNYLDTYFNTEYLYYDTSTEGVLPAGTATQSISASDADGALSSILSRYDEGLAITSYAGHCSQYGWGDPSWTTNYVATRSNYGKYTVMINNCCHSGRFKEEVNFAEQLMRLEDRGAVAYIGASNYSYWDLDYKWRVGYPDHTQDPEPSSTYSTTGLGAFDALFHTHDETYENQATTLGELLSIGNLATSNDGVNWTAYYWEIYHIFGDASMMTYLGIPQEMDITPPTSIFPDAKTLEIQAIPGAYVGLSIDGVLIDGGSADISSGIFNADLSNTTLSASLNVKLVITAPNKQPFIAEIPLAQLNEAYITIKGTTNETANPDSNVLIDLIAENLASSGTSSTASNVIVTLETSDQYTIISNNKNIGDLTAGQIENIADALEIKLNPNLIDQSEITITGNATSGSDSWPFTIRLTTSAPNLEITKLELLNNNSTEINPGESGIAVFTITNSGSQEISDVSFTTVVNKLGLTLGAFPENFNLDAGESKTIQVPIDVDSNVFVGANFSFNTTVQSGNYSTTTEISENIGTLIEHLLTKSEEITTCFATIYDDGGDYNNYSGALDNTLIVKPVDNYLKISATFESFDIEPYYDSLWIYNGNGSSRTLAAELSGNSSYEKNIVSEADDGSISIRIKTDQYDNYPGFEISIRCIDPDSSNAATDIVQDKYFNNIELSISFSVNKLHLIGSYQGLAEIYSITGEKVLTNNSFSSNDPIDTKDLKLGAYVLRLTNGKIFSFIKVQ